jgi:peroxiredoxin
MPDLTPLLPRRATPALSVSLAGETRSFHLGLERPDRFTLVVFYRGLHCPVCRTQLRELTTRLPDLADRGVGVVAISSDTRERAERAKANWGLEGLRVGYGLDLRLARGWGLYVSAGRGKTSLGIEEPAFFSEPGLFLIRADGTLYFASVQTMPFVRPAIDEVISAIDFVVAKDYPARGEIEMIEEATVAAA